MSNIGPSLSDTELQRLIDTPSARSGVGAERLLEAVLARIAREQPRLNAFITTTGELARADARRVDERREHGEVAGPLAGLPIAVKDNIDVAGAAATRGSSFFRDRVPERDAEVVHRLRAAGAVIVGKLALHEFAYGATTNNPHYGACRNPWDPDRIPGGSSGGAGAAVGADLCLGALGTDTGGSVRIPAALNGVSALRPTYGAVSNRGVFPISASLDTVGPVARSVADVARIFAVVAGYDRADPWAVEHPLDDPRAHLHDGAAGLRIGLPTSFFFDDLEPAIERNTHAVAERLAALGADVVEVDVPGAERAVDAATLLIRAEALALHRGRLDAEPERFGEDVRRRLELGRDISGADVADAIARMREWRAFMLTVFDDVDVVLTPTTNATAPRIDDAEMIATTARLTRFTYAWSLASMPAVSVPCGLDERGLPTGAQLAAAPWRDAVALRCGHALQSVTSWHRARPPLVDAPG
jgi:aspartyl-tRNA(Asn)/glutamyl-tRNA(Gln) amidotransferase subunit A